MNNRTNNVDLHTDKIIVVHNHGALLQINTTTLLALLPNGNPSV